MSLLFTCVGFEFQQFQFCVAVFSISAASVRSFSAKVPKSEKSASKMSGPGPDKEATDDPGYLIPTEKWLEKMDEVELYESDLHNVILNFLTVHGFQQAAEEFVKEARLESDIPLQSVGRRSEVRIALMRDDVEEAIRILNELDTEILKSNPDVHFRLKQQQLLQVIRDGKVDEAITFAREKLGPFVQQDQSLLPLLEDTMGLLAFNDLSKPGAQAQLEKLAPQKGETSSRVDSAILRYYDMQQESVLENILKNVVFSQKALTSKNVTFPRVTEFAQPRLPYIRGDSSSRHGSPRAGRRRKN